MNRTVRDLYLNKAVFKKTNLDHVVLYRDPLKTILI